jgi:hypothetical protein
MTANCSKRVHRILAVRRICWLTGFAKQIRQKIKSNRKIETGRKRLFSKKGVKKKAVMKQPPVKAKPINIFDKPFAPVTQQASVVYVAASENNPFP